MTPTQVADHAEKVVAGMSGGGASGNPLFPNPSPPLSTLTTLISQIRGGQNLVLGISNQLADAQGNVRDWGEELKSALGQEGNTVQGVADKQATEAEAVAVIKSANMGVRDSSGTPIGPLEAPKEVSLVDGHNDGELEAHCSKIRGASSYFFETCIGDNPITGAWGNGQPSSKTSITLKGFTTGQRVWMRVAGIGASDVRTWSAPISAIVT